jgi:hypothetical protein
MVTKDAHEGLVSRRVFELAAQRLRERQSPPRESPRTHDMPGWAGWSSPKARFILSGLCTCARCGSRYEGHGSPHGTKSGDTPRPKVWSYVCGGYIRHGRSTCQRGAIQQHILERAVVDAVRGFHHRFEGAQGRKALGAEVDRLLLGESESNADARKRLAKRLDRIDGTVRSLLDNLSPATKAVGERRILELEHERTDCLREIAALEALDSTRREARAMADEAAAFIASMLALLARWTSAPDPSLNDAITTALRRCVSSLTLEASTRSATLELRTLPVLAAGPAFTQSHTVRLDLPASR